MNRLIQSGYYKLTRRLFLSTIKRNAAFCIALFFLTLILLLGSIGQTGFTLAYESLIQKAGIPYIFLIALVLLATFEAYKINSDNYQSGGIYTLMMLPIPRRHIFLSYATTCLLSLLMLWVTQIIALVTAYLPVVAQCERFAAQYADMQDVTLPFTAARTNGLFLAVIRSDLLHILLPQSIPEALSSLLSLLALGFSVPYFALNGRTVRTNTVIMFIAGIGVIFSLFLRLDIIESDTAPWQFTLGIIVLAVALAVIITDGIRRMNHRINLKEW